MNKTTVVILCLTVSLFSCSRNVKFQDDYFLQTDRLSLDESLLGYYSVQGKEGTPLLFVLRQDRYTYKIYAFDRTELDDAKQETAVMRTIRIDDLLLAKCSESKEAGDEWLFLLRCVQDGGLVRVRAVPLDFAADFFAPYVQRGVLKGNVKKSQGTSGEEKTEVLITASYDEFAAFLRSNGASVRALFKDASPDDTLILARLPEK